MKSKTMRAILHALSYSNLEVESARRLADLKRLDPMRIFRRKLDVKIYNEDYEVPVRLYFPNEQAMKKGINKGHSYAVLLFFHGGGWNWVGTTIRDRKSVVPTQGDGQCGKLRPRVQSDGAVHRTDRSICGIPPCAGVSFSDRAYGLLRGCKSSVYEPVYFKYRTGKNHHCGRQRRRKSCSGSFSYGER